MAAPDPLDGIELLIFDKDGTLIEFQHMWADWVDGLAARLAAATGAPLRAGLYQLLGVDEATGWIHGHGLMAATPMSRIREVVEGYVAEAGNVSDARAAEAVDGAWTAPDPVALARPVTDLPALLARIRERVPHVAVATSDDRGPTERTLEALGIADQMAALVCADDGFENKPSPASVVELCRLTGIPAARTAVVGDSPADLRMGRAAGVRRTIGVLSGVGDRALLEPLADVILPSIADLTPDLI